MYMHERKEHFSIIAEPSMLSEQILLPLHVILICDLRRPMTKCYPVFCRYHDEIVTRVDLTCSSPIETQYYGAALVGFEDCCYHCGSMTCILEPTDPYIHDLKESFHMVRPICRGCRNGGKEAATRGPKNAKKKSRI